MVLLPISLFVFSCEEEQSEDTTPTEVTLWGTVYSIENTDSLDLSGNSSNGYDGGLTGEIPPEIGNLTNLTFLRLWGNQLSGSIPPEIGNLTNLTYLNLSVNQLTGEIPSEIGNLTNLTSLVLERNQLTGSIPPEIGNLTNLTNLSLFENQLTGLIPESVCDFNNMFFSSVSFFISYNQFCPPYPSCVEDYVGEQDTSYCGD